MKRLLEDEYNFYQHKDKSDDFDLAEMYETMSLEQIGARIGMSRSGVYRRLKSAGVKMRQSGVAI